MLFHSSNPHAVLVTALMLRPVACLTSMLFGTVFSLHFRFKKKRGAGRRSNHRSSAKKSRCTSIRLTLLSTDKRHRVGTFWKNFRKKKHFYKTSLACYKKQNVSLRHAKEVKLFYYREMDLDSFNFTSDLSWELCR